MSKKTIMAKQIEPVEELAELKRTLGRFALNYSDAQLVQLNREITVISTCLLELFLIKVNQNKRKRGRKHV